MCATPLCSVGAAQPIFAAIGSIAAHCEDIMDDAGKPLPSGLQLSGLDPEFCERPHPILDDLRVRAPRHRHEFGLFVTTQADGRAALVDPKLSRDPRKAPEDAFSRLVLPPEIARGERPANMLWLDEPEHGVNRGLVQPAFFKRCGGMRQRISAIVDELLDEIERKRNFDGIDDFGVPLPIYVIADILGLPRSDLPLFRRRSFLVANLGLTPFRTPEQEALRAEQDAALEAYFLEVIAERRAAPRDDLISDLIAARHEGQALSDGELVSICFLLLLAGNLTTTDMLAHGIVELLEHPEQAAKLRADPALARSAVEEILRYEPPVRAAGRHSNISQEVLGCPVAAGQSVGVSLQACNRDPAVFDDPHAFRIDRQKNEHLSFGGGAHQCLGAPLARLEGEIALRTLFSRFPHLRLSEGRPPRRPSFAFNTYERLPLSIDPA